MTRLQKAARADERCAALVQKDSRNPNSFEPCSRRAKIRGLCVQHAAQQMKEARALLAKLDGGKS